MSTQQTSFTKCEQYLRGSNDQYLACMRGCIFVEGIGHGDSHPLFPLLFVTLYVTPSGIPHSWQPALGITNTDLFLHPGFVLGCRVRGDSCNRPISTDAISQQMRELCIHCLHTSCSTQSLTTKCLGIDHHTSATTKCLYW